MAGYEGLPLDAEWRSFAERVVPADASDTQRRESRRCFYAGAQALQHIVMRGLSSGREVTEADMAKMALIQRELRIFLADVEAGRA